MKIYFNDLNIPDDSGFTVEMVTVPRVGENIYFGVKLLPENVCNFLNLNAVDGVPVVKVYSWLEGRVICAKVRQVSYVVLQESQGINVIVDYLAVPNAK